jgi:hypothetical protein
MFIAALFKIVKICKQSSCSSSGEWINCDLQTMEYYLVMERNELSRPKGTCKSLKHTLLSQRGLSWKGYLLYDSKYLSVEKGKTMGTVKTLSGFKG